MNYWRAWTGSGYETEVLLRFGVIKNYNMVYMYTVISLAHIAHNAINSLRGLWQGTVFLTG